MPTHRCLRPIILSAAYQLPPIPHRLLCSPITHQHHHRRTTATLRPPYRSQSYAFSAGSAIAAMFGAVLWLRPKRTRADYVHNLEKFINSELRKAFHEDLGCQNIKFEPSRPIAPDLEIGFFWDADAPSGAGPGSLLGVCLNSLGREKIWMVDYLRKILEDWDNQGVLRRQGKAVCILSCRGVAGIWVWERVADA